jgi:hypothetical protein
MKNGCFNMKPVNGNYHVCIFIHRRTHL